jgi:hypothetical protein
MKIFNIDNVTLGNSETLDISKSGDGNAVLLAISAILQSDKTEAELTELLSTINTDIRTDGTLDSTSTKATLVTAMEYLKTRQSTIRSNIESRYSNLGISATIPAFESYAFKLDTTAPTVSSTSPSDGATIINPASSISVIFSEVMDTSSITVNSSDTDCSGTFQVSSDNFSNCVQVSSSPSASNSDKTFTVTPSSSLSNSTSYKIRFTTGTKDIAGNELATQYTSSSGLTTWSNASSYITTLIVVGSNGDVCVELNKWGGCSASDTQYTQGTHSITVTAGGSIGFEIHTNTGYTFKFTDPDGTESTGSSGTHRGPLYSNVRENKSVKVEFQ